MRRRPDFLIIGAMKCMTSTLHSQLALQDGFFLSDPKEPCFFSNDEVYAKGIDWYEGLFAAAKEGELVGESSTHYSKLPTYPFTIQRMMQDVPDAKFIYVMRHPIDRLVSHYIHAWTEGAVSGSLDEAIDKHPELTEYSRYDFQLAPYLEAFGSDRVLPVFYDRLRTYSQVELARIVAFLRPGGIGVWSQQEVAQNVSAERIRKSSLRDAIVYAPGLSWVRRTMVPRSVRNYVKGFWQMKVRPQLSPERHDDLVATFDQSLKRLGSWVGLDLDCDNFRVKTRENLPRWSSEALKEFCVQGVSLA
ncbi:sulfotransferase family protein [Blastopirellula marina]|uniref:Sulfotransferase n=1 Tax=Blastopirellula marina TaxID=124 RepID=A0A2S8GNP0_9BACT|nr:sulfotransferase [Blastopirellula marina]PQO45971.1 sulfotransferase [Blastopirellula marina]